MTTTPDYRPPQPLVSRWEIALMLGSISRTRTKQITQHPTFPEPYAEVHSCTLWRTDDVTDWIKRRPEIMAERGRR